MPALNSSNLATCEYDDDARELLISFRSGSVYVYQGVPRDVYEELIGSLSPGRFFYQAIRDSYSFRREA